MLLAGRTSAAHSRKESARVSPYVQGMERRNHAPNLLSDDTKDVRGSSLQSLAGRTISWHYADGSSDTADLF